MSIGQDSPRYYPGTLPIPIVDISTITTFTFAFAPFSDKLSFVQIGSVVLKLSFLKIETKLSMQKEIVNQTTEIPPKCSITTNLSPRAYYHFGVNLGNWDRY